MADYSVSVSILKLLLTAKNKSPVSYKTIKRYLKHSYSSIQLYCCLENLYTKKFIDKLGRRRSYKYSISDRGISHLDKLEQKIFLKNMEVEISKYLHILNGVTDT
jgi:hypothetical protein